jgi:hypothetical protein
MFARVVVNAGKAMRVGAVRGLMVPAARALPQMVAGRFVGQTARSFSNLADVLATVINIGFIFISLYC